MCCSKAYNVINYIFRCFITDNVTAILIAYIAYARHHLEFASTVWNPGIEAKGYIGLKRQLEKVQKYFTRRLFGRCKIPYLSYDERIKFLDIDSFEIRRMRFDLIMLYKLINGLNDIDPSSIIQIQTINITRGHSKRLLIDKARIDLFIKYIYIYNISNKSIIQYNIMLVKLTQLRKAIYNAFDL